MDDDDQKIRRNLVAFSSAVLLLAWLDIPFSALLGKLIDVKVSQPSDSRLWIAGLVVLTYLGIRYSFSAEGRKYRDELNRELQSIKVGTAIALAQRQADYFSWTGHEPSVFSGKLTSYIEDKTKDMGEQVKSYGRPKIELSMSEYDQAPYRFTMSSVLTWYSKGKSVGSSHGGLVITVDITGIYRFYVSVYSHLHAFSYSSSSINYLAPAVLGVAAAVTLTSQICLAYWRV